jgi:hypothetical protein
MLLEQFVTFIEDFRLPLESNPTSVVVLSRPESECGVPKTRDAKASDVIKGKGSIAKVMDEIGRARYCGELSTLEWVSCSICRIRIGCVQILSWQ